MVEQPGAVDRDTRKVTGGRPVERGAQARIGLVLAIAIIAGWLAVHIYGMLFYSWNGWSVVTAPLLASWAFCWSHANGQARRSRSWRRLWLAANPIPR